ncbi:CgeB family protein [Paenibacillus thalictri]|uniref:Spore maturation protein cgeB n=1 Tax=Paenibacillus thalictri TaxID=2527873 RepID=A0A4Q9DZZ8_9BACL|nr:glycosyltransferase [Paenibacillus thalictri]TBL81740.1 spore maturation protein cgeB [Paenibacillus thalictri]
MARVKRKSKNKRLPRGSYQKGWNEGFAAGRPYGYHLGACESAVKSCAGAGAGAQRPVRVLFVVSGQGDPYATIERGLLEALRPLVAELLVVSPFDDVAGAAITARPDLVLVFNGLNYVSPETIQSIRNNGVRTAVWFTDDPYYADLSVNIALQYDLVFTQELSCVELYRTAGCTDVHYIPLAASPRIYRPQRVAAVSHTDVCFLGTAYRSRIGLFDQMAAYLAGKKTLIVGRWWERLGSYELLKPAIRGEAAWLSTDDTVSCYNGAHIVINHHRTFDDDEVNANTRRVPAFSPNPRTFEIAACGTLQMVDAREDIARFYTPGQEIVTYSSVEDLTGKLEYYLSHPIERNRIALGGLVRTLKEHTYPVRLQTLLKAAFGG